VPVPRDVDALLGALLPDKGPTEGPLAYDPRQEAIANYMREQGDYSRMPTYDPGHQYRGQEVDNLYPREEPRWTDIEEQGNRYLSPFERRMDAKAAETEQDKNLMADVLEEYYRRLDEGANP
jgi:hypothetical protein